MEVHAMQIRDTRHTTLDRFSIEDLHVTCEHFDYSDPASFNTYVRVSLKPEPYMRNRFAEGGQSVEVKKTGARELIIHQSELQKMMEAISDELHLCYKV